MNSIMIIYACFLRLFFKLSGKDFFIGKGSGIHPLAYVQASNGRIHIGDNSFIMRGATVMTYGGDINIGNDVTLNPYVVLYGHGGIALGNDVRVATHAVIVSFDHIYESKDILIRQQGEIKEKIVIQDDVWIGAGAKILAGTTISKGCVVGANSVLKGKTEPYSVYVGIPARKIKERV